MNPCIGRWTLNLWTSRKVHFLVFLMIFHLEPHWLDGYHPLRTSCFLEAANDSPRSMPFFCKLTNPESILQTLLGWATIYPYLNYPRAKHWITWGTSLPQSQLKLFKVSQPKELPGGSVVKNLPANAGDMGSVLWARKIPRAMEQLNQCTTTTEPWALAHALQEKPPQWEAQALQQISLHSSQQERAHRQQTKTNTGKNKNKYINFLKVMVCVYVHLWDLIQYKVKC